MILMKILIVHMLPNSYNEYHNKWKPDETRTITKGNKYPLIQILGASTKQIRASLDPFLTTKCKNIVRGFSGEGLSSSGHK
jgi:hypothetical protein